MKPATPLLNSPARGAFRARLLRWFDEHKRDLPWRDNHDPYRVWLAEIMLQQTRVAAVIDHYQRFLRKFPTLQKLAASRESDVLAAWSGLGYYRRARAMHAAAREVACRGFPQDAEGLRSLPGIGRYTAAAIASIAFGEPCAVVDGNVRRVLGRLFAPEATGGEDSWSIAQQLLCRKRPGDFNQAMMELGATVCLPGMPWCDRCPVFRWCKTRGPEPAVRNRRRQKKHLAYRLALGRGAVFLVQRGDHVSLMPKMWELPEARNGRSLGARKKPLFRVRHSITTTDYVVSVIPGRGPQNGGPGQWVKLARVRKLPLTGLTRKILRASKII